MTSRYAAVVACVAASMAWAVQTRAAIVQPTPGQTLPSDLPTGAVGKWGANAGAVAIAPDLIVTTRHQDNADQARKVVFGATEYKVVQQWTFDPPGDTVDLRLVRIEKENGDPAALTDYVSLYSGDTIGGLTAAIGGYGPTIGALDVDGYDWTGNVNSNNNSLTFGQNKILGAGPLEGGDYENMSVLVAVFDEAGTAGAVDFEVTLAPGDSGGGWFVLDNGEWKLVGLTHAVDLDAAGAFTADAFYGQIMQAVDLRPFVSDINALVPEPTTAALLGSLLMLTMRRRPPARRGADSPAR